MIVDVDGESRSPLGRLFVLLNRGGVEVGMLISWEMRDVRLVCVEALREQRSLT